MKTETLPDFLNKGINLAQPRLGCMVGKTIAVVVPFRSNS